jgi:hypothetical protein
MTSYIVKFYFGPDADDCLNVPLQAANIEAAQQHVASQLSSRGEVLNVYTDLGTVAVIRVAAVRFAFVEPAGVERVSTVTTPASAVTVVTSG